MAFRKTGTGRRMLPSQLAAAGMLLASSAPAFASVYSEELAALRQERSFELTRQDGWLTLVGLHFLAPGPNSVGHAADNRIVLAAGPEHFGTVTLEASGAATFAPSPGADATVDGQPARTVPLRIGDDDTKPTTVSSGTVSFFLIERGGKLALRVKDSAADRRRNFAGLEYFPTDPSWRIDASWVPFDSPHDVPITNILGNVSLEKVPGKAVFERGGKTYELFPILEGPDEPLFFVFSDATSGDTTYHMRFLEAKPPKDGKVVLDFNQAINPPCAFTPFATCPLPPKENHLGLSVAAGEKKYRGGDAGPVEAVR